MARNRKKTALSTVRHRSCLFTALVTLAASQGADAGWYFVPSISLSAAYDDNLFYASENETSDTIARATPALSLGYESEKSTMGVDYRRDLESYADNSDLNDDAVRQFLEASLIYRPTTAVVLSLVATRTESVFPSELNLATGLGTNRTPSKRTTVNPGISYNFSAKTKGLLEYIHTEEDTEGGTDGEVSALNTEFSHALSNRSQVTFGYTYSEYEFSNGLVQPVHTPRVGFMHAFSERTTLSIATGPRFTEGDDSVDVNFSASLNYVYDGGDLLLGYDREVVTLIGEPGIAESNGVSATMRYNFSEALAVSATTSYGRFTRPSLGGERTNVLRVGLNANYAVNRAVSLFAGYDHSRQDGSSQAVDPFEVSRNVINVGVTLRLPRG